jgi:hypothetical protein
MVPETGPADKAQNAEMPNSANGINRQRLLNFKTVHAALSFQTLG